MAISPCVNWSGAVLHELSSLSPLLRDESPPTAIKRWSFSRSSPQPISESTVNLQQRHSHCVRGFRVCSHTQMIVALKDLSQQKPRWQKQKGEFGFFTLKKYQLNRILKRTERNPKLILSTFYSGAEADQIVSRRHMGRGDFALHFEKAAFLYVASQVST